MTSDSSRRNSRIRESLRPLAALRSIVLLRRHRMAPYRQCKQLVVLLWAFVALLSQGPLVSPAHAQLPITDIYMGLAGDDLSDGLTPSSPVRTFERVKQIAASINQDINVQIYPETYHGESLVWDNQILDGQIITFRPWEGLSGRPTFVGPGLIESPDNSYNIPFFTLQSPNGVPTNIRFWHLQIERYKDGILFNGSPGDRKGWNSDNQVVDVWFVRIGDKWAGDGETDGYKALGLTNSRYNYIRFNRFMRCENAALPELIHALYLAHWTTHNDIRYNYFGHVSGDAIKTRDQSGDNVVWGNAFWMSGSKAATVGDWYQNPTDNPEYRTGWDGNGQRWECPSAMNNVRYNIYGNNYGNAATLPQVLSVGGSKDCPDYTNDNYFKSARQEYDCPCGRDRFTTANNEYTAYWSTISSTLADWETTVIAEWRAANNIL